MTDIKEQSPKYRYADRDAAIDKYVHHLMFVGGHGAGSTGKIKAYLRDVLPSGALPDDPWDALMFASEYAASYPDRKDVVSVISRFLEWNLDGDLSFKSKKPVPAGGSTVDGLLTDDSRVAAPLVEPPVAPEILPPVAPEPPVLAAASTDVVEPPAAIATLPLPVVPIEPPSVPLATSSTDVALDATDIVLALIRASGTKGKSEADISQEATSLSRSTVQRRLRSLASFGHIVRRTETGDRQAHRGHSYALWYTPENATEWYTPPPKKPEQPFKYATYDEAMAAYKVYCLENGMNEGGWANTKKYIHVTLQDELIDEVTAEERLAGRRQRAYASPVRRFYKFLRGEPLDFQTDRQPAQPRVEVPPPPPPASAPPTRLKHTRVVRTHDTISLEEARHVAPDVAQAFVAYRDALMRARQAGWTTTSIHAYDFQIEQLIAIGEDPNGL